MRKVVMFFIAVIFSLSLMSCKEDNVEDSGPYEYAILIQAGGDYYELKSKENSDSFSNSIVVDITFDGRSHWFKLEYFRFDDERKDTGWLVEDWYNCYYFGRSGSYKDQKGKQERMDIDIDKGFEIYKVGTYYLSFTPRPDLSKKFGFVKSTVLMIVNVKEDTQ